MAYAWLPRRDRDASRNGSLKMGLHAIVQNWTRGHAEIRQKLGHSFCKSMILKFFYPHPQAADHPPSG
ncbi:conserved protein of unknown function [Ectopseudomonas oleovorans]|uniref:Uncharacterized protein n=1 Tax=Ectopseudomonas oleovorans TaxID=301 RepID=A0A653BBT2_ECTOL|nr:conserved protein of unknown function [Pseudomonas oleovorans]